MIMKAQRPSFICSDRFTFADDELSFSAHVVLSSAAAARVFLIQIFVLAYYYRTGTGHNDSGSDNKQETATNVELLSEFPFH